MVTAKKATGTAKAAPRKRAVVRQPRVAPAPQAKAPARPAPPKLEKPRKPKLVRDSFTIPKAEYAVIDELKQRVARAGTPAKKSELLRAGLKVLATLGDHGFLTALAAVPAIKTGRPAKD